MKGGKLYMAFLGIALVLVFFYEYSAPHKFVWTQTFDKNDKEPFGCYVFDDILSSSVDDYKVVDKTFYQLSDEDSATPRAFLAVENFLGFNEGENSADIEYLDTLLKRGNQIILCSEYFPYSLKMAIGLETENDVYSPSLQNYLKGNAPERVKIYLGKDTLNPVQVFDVYPQMLRVHIVKDDDEARAGYPTFNCDSVETLVWDDRYRPLAIRMFIGPGELFIVSTPLMFTNYSMLDGANAAYVFRLLSYTKGKPLVRIEAYGNHGDELQTPLRYILSVAPLRWAVYVALLLLILFFIDAARRRQRVIPVVTPEPNRTLGFVQLISNLYYQRHNNDEILKMKHLYFSAEVKRLTGIDLYESVPDTSDYERLSEMTGVDVETLSALLREIQMAVYRSSVDDLQLKNYIDSMNGILDVLKI